MSKKGRLVRFSLLYLGSTGGGYCLSLFNELGLNTWRVLTIIQWWVVSPKEACSDHWKLESHVAVYGVWYTVTRVTCCSVRWATIRLSLYSFKFSLLLTVVVDSWVIYLLLTVELFTSREFRAPSLSCVLLLFDSVWRTKRGILLAPSFVTQRLQLLLWQVAVDNLSHGTHTNEWCYAHAGECVSWQVGSNDICSGTMIYGVVNLTYASDMSSLLTHTLFLIYTSAMAQIQRGHILQKYFPSSWVDWHTE